MSEAGARILAAAAELSFPRLTGSPGEARARAWLEQRLAAAGFEVARRPFRYSFELPMARMRTGLRLLSLAVALTVLMAVWTGWPGLVPLVGLGAVGLLELRRAFFDDESFQLDQPEAELETANLSVRGGIASPKRVVLMAHFDSKSQNSSFLARAAWCLIAIAGLTTLPWCFAAAPNLWWALPPLCSAIALRQLAQLTFENDSPGALDNAGSVGVVLEVLRRLHENPPPQTEVLAIFTGAEEHAMAGARIVARDHAEIWRAGRTLVINHDGVGAPGPVGISGKTPKWFSGARRVRLPIGTGTDAMPLAAAKLDVVTLSSTRLSRAVLAIHTARDRAANLDPQALAAAADLSEALARGHALHA
jgi:acetylornithine deacetylase/succinyl-diaminopimelate desuccinylase-like protein